MKKQNQPLVSSLHRSFRIKNVFRGLLCVGILSFLTFGVVSCDTEVDRSIEVKAANGGEPTRIDSISPRIGGIATPILIYGKNFGTDTTKLHVYFRNKKDPSKITRANIISSNGDIIYLNTPKLTYQDSLDVMIDVVADNGEQRLENGGRFDYKTERTVTTVAGIPFPSQGSAYTKGGALSQASFSCPMFICVDKDKNVIVVERSFQKSAPEMDTGLTPRLLKNDGNLQGYYGLISMLNEKNNDVTVLKEATTVNAPTVSPDGKTVYVPFDDKFGYYSMLVEDGYRVRERAFKAPSGYGDENKGNWKFSFVTNPKDSNKYASVYTLMYNKELIKIDPLTNASEMVIKEISTPFGSDTYLAFNPKEDRVLYASVTNTHSIYRVDLKKDPIVAEPYAGIVLTKPKPATTKDGAFANGSLRAARFNYPRQITFDDDGVMYIADCVNHCIRSINVEDGTKSPQVEKVVGIQGVSGYVDGGPDVSQLNYPMGIAKAFDGTIYIADTRNYAIRKLVIQ